jgi:ankyrin repeat protein
MKRAMPMFVMLLAATAMQAATREEELLDAVRKGDAAAVKALLDQGVPVDTKFRYDRTALSFAADRGHVEIVKLLLERGADPDAADSFYHQTPLASAAYKGNAEVVRILLERSKQGVGSALLGAIFAGKPEVVDVVLATGRVSTRDLSYALEVAAKNAEAGDIAERLRKAGATPPPPADKTVDPAVLGRYAGRYREENGNEEFTLAVTEGALTATFGGRTFKLGAIDAQHFRNSEAIGVTLEMRQEGERVVGATVAQIGSETRYVRVEEAKP